MLFTYIGFGCPFPVVFVGPKTRVFKCRFIKTFFVSHNSATAVIKVQVGKDYVGDVVAVKPSFFKR